MSQKRTYLHVLQLHLGRPPPTFTNQPKEQIITNPHFLLVVCEARERKGSLVYLDETRRAVGGFTGSFQATRRGLDVGERPCVW